MMDRGTWVGQATGGVLRSKAARGRVVVQNISKRQYIAAIQNIPERRETRRTPKNPKRCEGAPHSRAKRYRDGP